LQHQHRQASGLQQHQQQQPPPPPPPHFVHGQLPQGLHHESLVGLFQQPVQPQSVGVNAASAANRKLIDTFFLKGIYSMV